MKTSSEKPVENAKEPAALRHRFQMPGTLAHALYSLGGLSLMKLAKRPKD